MLLIEARLGCSHVYVFIQMDHGGSRLAFIGGLWGPERRCCEPLWIVLDSVSFLFRLGFLGNLSAYVNV